eukprot:m.892287 g.892287  ORF g.892287 m.892287 type:complete len:506 (+) comp23655_c0_seq4:202-1719(+)
MNSENILPFAEYRILKSCLQILDDACDDQFNKGPTQRFRRSLYGRLTQLEYLWLKPISLQRRVLQQTYLWFCKEKESLPEYVLMAFSACEQRLSPAGAFQDDGLAMTPLVRRARGRGLPVDGATTPPDDHTCAPPCIFAVQYMGGQQSSLGAVAAGADRSAAAPTTAATVTVRPLSDSLQRSARGRQETHPVQGLRERPREPRARPWYLQRRPRSAPAVRRADAGTSGVSLVTVALEGARATPPSTQSVQGAELRTRPHTADSIRGARACHAGLVHDQDTHPPSLHAGRASGVPSAPRGAGRNSVGAASPSHVRDPHDVFADARFAATEHLGTAAFPRRASTRRLRSPGDGAAAVTRPASDYVVSGRTIITSERPPASVRWPATAQTAVAPATPPPVRRGGVGEGGRRAAAVPPAIHTVSFPEHVEMPKVAAVRPQPGAPPPMDHVLSVIESRLQQLVRHGGVQSAARELNNMNLDDGTLHRLHTLVGAALQAHGVPSDRQSVCV